MLEESLAEISDLVERQSAVVYDPATGRSLELVNLVARRSPEVRRRVLLGTHWDTRRWADEDPDPGLRRLPVPGANDGTSGVVVLMEILRILHDDKGALPGVGVDVVLFDGEEIGAPGPPPCCPGSRRFAEDAASFYPHEPPVAAIVLDMVGDRQLTLLREAGSQLRAGWLNDLVWRAGRRRAPTVFVDDIQPHVLDDHVALQQVGIPAILLIDLEYDAWHTRADTQERVSASSLATVGAVLLDVLADLARGAMDHTAE